MLITLFLCKQVYTKGLQSMDINELKQLNTDGFLRRVSVQTTLNHRAMKEHKVFVTFIATSGNYTGEVTFMLQHACLRSLVLTKQLLDDNGIPYVYTDLASPMGSRKSDEANLTPQQPVKSAFCSPDARVAAEPFPVPSNCNLCGKTSFDTALGCLNSAVFSIRSGDWACNLMRATA